MRASVFSAASRPREATSRLGAGLLRLALLLVLLVAFGLRLQELARQDIWWDEARNIDVALRPFWQIPTAPELDIQPPVYYWLLHAWNGLFGVAVGQPPAGLALASRLLSVFGGVLGVALLVPLARRVLPPGPGAASAGPLAALAGAAAPFWLAESQEARMYTVGFALLAAAALALLRYIDCGGWGCTKRRSGENPTDHPFQGRFWRPWNVAASDLAALIAFVLLAAAALLTHYNAVFVLVTWFAWWFVWALRRPDRRRQLRALFATGLALALLVLPILPVALRQIPDYENPNITIPSVGDYLLQNWRAYAGGYAFDPALLGGNGSLWLWLVLVIGAVGIGIAAWTIAQSSRRAADSPLHPVTPSPAHPLTRLTFLLAWLLGGLALYYVAVLDRNAFNVRYASFVTPALYALLGVGLAAYGRWWRPLPALGAVLLLVGLVPALQADLYDPRFDREHTGEVAAWLRANTGPGDVIFVDQKYPFGFYYQPYEIPDLTGQGTGAADRSLPLPAPSEVGEDGAPLARYLFVDINTIDQRLTEWAGAARRVFWLQWFESDTDPRHAVRFLLDKYGRFAGEQAFQGYLLQWWDLDPPTHFELAPDLQPVDIEFWGLVKAVAASWPQAPLHPGDPLPVAIRWQLNPLGIDSQVIRGSRKVRVALYDEAGARLAQADERLLNDRHRGPAQWEPDDQPLNVYLLSLPADLPPGKYSLGLLVYVAETLEAVAEEKTLGTVEVKN